MTSQQPNVYTAPNTPKSKKWGFGGWRIIYPVLGLVLLIELIWGFKTLMAPLPKVQSETGKLLLNKGAKILLNSPKTNFKSGDSIPVTIQVSTGGYATIGTDFILRFDPKILEASAGAFTGGKIYEDYPLTSVDGKNGVIRISGVSSIGKKGFNGIGELGVINFKAKNKGTTTLMIDFRNGKTNDSNVMSFSTNKDLLNEVNNLKITVQ